MLADPAALGDQFTTAPATGSSGKYNLYLKFDGSPDADTVEGCGRLPPIDTIFRAPFRVQPPAQNTI